MVQRTLTWTIDGIPFRGTEFDAQAWTAKRDARIETQARMQELRNMTTKVSIGPDVFMYARDGSPILYLSREAAILSRGTHE